MNNLPLPTEAEHLKNWDSTYYLPFQISQYIIAGLYYASAFHAGYDFYTRRRSGKKLSANQPLLWMLLFFTLGGIVYGTHWITYALASIYIGTRPDQFYVMYSMTGFLGNIGLLFGFLGCQAFTFQLFNLNELSSRLMIDISDNTHRLPRLKRVIIAYLIFVDSALLALSIVGVCVPFIEFAKWNFIVYISRLVFVSSVIPVCIANFYYGWRVVKVIRYNMDVLNSGRTTISGIEFAPTTQTLKSEGKEMGLSYSGVGVPTTDNFMITAEKEGKLQSANGDLNLEKGMEEVKTSPISEYARTKNRVPHNITELSRAVHKLRIANYILSFGIYGYMAVFGLLPTFFVQPDFRPTLVNLLSLIIIRTIFFGGGLLICVNCMIYYCRNDSRRGEKVHLTILEEQRTWEREQKLRRQMNMVNGASDALSHQMVQVDGGSKVMAHGARSYDVGVMTSFGSVETIGGDVEIVEMPSSMSSLSGHSSSGMEPTKSTSKSK